MSIQYTVLGFELTTYCMPVSSHNHLTKARAHRYYYLSIELYKRQLKI